MFTAKLVLCGGILLATLFWGWIAAHSRAVSPTLGDVLICWVYSGAAFIAAGLIGAIVFLF